MKKLENLQSKSIKKSNLKHFVGALRAITELTDATLTFVDTNCTTTGKNGSIDCEDSGGKDADK
ncbi:hypothetical protein K0U91_07080 [Chryseobacterium chendengshani]|uniref:hypothetical protein n=1 Tax=Chryseobacterium sp. LJ668 TaxID=2864040 RepID=UPI001C687C7B|nr:hypothetical protein [Chryseobacterium sp. LJ668]MBW8522231.1 hypothetical protein [Chryseobacterium sp. LJ668]QYK17874.1 hypothetical protein K0U91_07080 [Chryseobacterium sp. LJ668]